MQYYLESSNSKHVHFLKPSIIKVKLCNQGTMYKNMGEKD